jgi:signal transduction histidine kinase
MNAGLTAVGFGMKNLKARVEYLGGDIQVSSKPMSGTVVRIFIPTNKVPYTAVAALD